MKMKRIIATVAASVLALGMIAGCGCTKDNTAKTESTVYKPTFMYFVSNKDADFENTNAMFEELQKKYEDDVKFNLINVDDNPEMLQNFQLVDGNTPALIMLNTSNDISAMEFKCSDKEKLEQDIKSALK